MDFKILPNGNLEITMEPKDREEIEEMVEKYPNDVLFMSNLLEYTGWTPNGSMYLLDAKDVGGLTEAPIVTDDMTIEEDSSITVHGPVWWYPNYMVTHFGKELLDEGRTVFTLASDVA